MKLFSLGLSNRLPFAVRSVLDRKIIETASSLYAAQALNYLLPLVMIPYLARVLGPETWGIVMFIQAIGMYVLMVIDYSFELSATRSIARHRDDEHAITEIVSGVLGAKLFLAVACILVVGLAQLFLPTLRELGLLLWLGVLWFSTAALRPFWFFLGLERVRSALIIEVLAKCSAVGAVLLLVNSAADVWLVFALQAAGSALSVVGTTALMYRSVTFQLPSFSGTMSVLKEGWNLFLFRVSTSVHGMSNTIILGFLAAPIAVAYYAAAERILRVPFAMLWPIMQALLPRASTLVRDDEASAARFACISTVSFFSLSVVGSIALFFMSPIIVRVLLGAGYEESVPVVRVMLLLLPILGINIPLASQWIIPLGLDGLLTKVTIAGGILHIPVAVTLGFQFAHIGMAWALVITETFILSVLIGVLIARGQWPFRLRFHPEAIDSTRT